MPSARSVIQLGAALLLAGALFDSPSLYVPGAGLLTVAAGFFAWVRLAASGLKVSRAAGPATAVEGEPYPLRVQIVRGRLPLPGGELRDPALERPLALGPDPPRVLTESIRMGRRGRRKLDATTLAIRDPLRLWEHEVKGAGEAEILVLPRTEPVRAPGEGNGHDGRLGGLGREGDGGDRGTGLRSAALASEVDGVRPHEDGVPASRIHWRTVARSGELFDRVLVPGSESSHAVVLDAAGALDTDALDRAVRAAASLCLHLAPMGGCALHLPGRARPLPIDPRLRGWPQAHGALALVEAADDSAADAKRSSRGDAAPAVRGGHRGLCVWVRGAPEAPDPRELARAASSASHLVAPVEVPGLVASFRVSGCSGYSLRGASRRVKGAA
jgi:uncharacterized protein (DUF58 family)